MKALGVSRLRVTSFILCMTFVAQDAAFAAPSPMLPQPASAFTIPQVAFRLPESVAQIDDGYAAPNASKTLFLLQDAHTNESGQINLANALRQILPSEGITHVFTEASQGDMSVGYFKKVFEPKVMEPVAMSYLRKGVLKGDEYLGLTSDLNFTIWGVEDPSLYNAALEAYKKVADQRTAVLGYLDRLTRTASVLKEALYGPDLKSVDSARAAYLKGDKPLTDYFEALHVMAKKTGVYLPQYRHLSRLKAIRSLESRVDFKAAAAEQDKAIQSLPQQVQSDLRAASRKSRSPFRIGGDDHAADKGFYALLEASLRDASGAETASAKTGSYPELFKYFSYLKASKKLDAQGVLNEIEALERDVFGRLAAADDAALLVKLSRNLESLTRMIELKLTPDEFADYLRNEPSFDIRIISGFFNKKIMDLAKHYDRTVLLEGEYSEASAAAKKFYELALDRDRAFIAGTLKKMDAAKLDKAVLVTGGFHTPNLKELLKRKGISYVSIRPQVSHETNTDRYEDLLFRQLASAQKAARAATSARASSSGQHAAMTAHIEMPIPAVQAARLAMVRDFADAAQADNQTVPADLGGALAAARLAVRSGGRSAVLESLEERDYLTPVVPLDPATGVDTGYATEFREEIAAAQGIYNPGLINDTSSTDIPQKVSEFTNRYRASFFRMDKDYNYLAEDNKYAWLRFNRGRIPAENGGGPSGRFDPGPRNLSINPYAAMPVNSQIRLKHIDRIQQSLPDEIPVDVRIDTNSGELILTDVDGLESSRIPLLPELADKAEESASDEALRITDADGWTRGPFTILIIKGERGGEAEQPVATIFIKSDRSKGVVDAVLVRTADLSQMVLDPAFDERVDEGRLPIGISTGRSGSNASVRMRPDEIHDLIILFEKDQTRLKTNALTPPVVDDVMSQGAEFWESAFPAGVDAPGLPPAAVDRVFNGLGDAGDAMSDALKRLTSGARLAAEWTRRTLLKWAAVSAGWGAVLAPFKKLLYAEPQNSWDAAVDRTIRNLSRRISLEKIEQGLEGELRNRNLTLISAVGSPNWGEDGATIDSQQQFGIFEFNYATGTGRVVKDYKDAAGLLADRELTAGLKPSAAGRIQEFVQLRFAKTNRPLTQKWSDRSFWVRIGNGPAGSSGTTLRYLFRYDHDRYLMTDLDGEEVLGYADRDAVTNSGFKSLSVDLREWLRNREAFIAGQHRAYPDAAAKDPKALDAITEMNFMVAGDRNNPVFLMSAPYEDTVPSNGGVYRPLIYAPHWDRHSDGTLNARPLQIHTNPAAIVADMEGDERSIGNGVERRVAPPKRAAAYEAVSKALEGGYYLRQDAALVLGNEQLRGNIELFEYRGKDAAKSADQILNLHLRKIRAHQSRFRSSTYGEMAEKLKSEDPAEWRNLDRQIRGWWRKTGEAKPAAPAVRAVSDSLLNLNEQQVSGLLNRYADDTAESGIIYEELAGGKIVPAFIRIPGWSYSARNVHFALLKPLAEELDRRGLDSSNVLSPQVLAHLLEKVRQQRLDRARPEGAGARFAAASIVRFAADLALDLADAVRALWVGWTLPKDPALQTERFLDRIEQEPIVLQAESEERVIAMARRHLRRLMAGYSLEAMQQIPAGITHTIDRDSPRTQYGRPDALNPEHIITENHPILTIRLTDAESLRRKVRRNGAIVFIGPPGAGKGEQSKYLRREFGAAVIGPGNYFRGVDKLKELGGVDVPNDPNLEYFDEAALTQIYRHIQGILDRQKADLADMRSGGLMKDDSTIEIINYLLSFDVFANAPLLVFDGFPRTTGQYDAILEGRVKVGGPQGRALKIGAHIVMNFSSDAVMRETIERRFRRPDRSGRADADKEIQRAETYNRETRPIVDFLLNRPNTIRLFADDRHPTDPAASIQLATKELEDGLRAIVNGARLAEGVGNSDFNLLVQHAGTRIRDTVEALQLSDEKGLADADHEAGEQLKKVFEVLYAGNVEILPAAPGHHTDIKFIKGENPRRQLHIEFHPADAQNAEREMARQLVRLGMLLLVLDPSVHKTSEAILNLQRDRFMKADILLTRTRSSHQDPPFSRTDKMKIEREMYQIIQMTDEERAAHEAMIKVAQAEDRAKAERQRRLDVAAGKIEPHVSSALSLYVSQTTHMIEKTRSLGVLEISWMAYAPDVVKVMMISDSAGRQEALADLMASIINATMQAAAKSGLWETPGRGAKFDPIQVQELLENVAQGLINFARSRRAAGEEPTDIKTQLLSAADLIVPNEQIYSYLRTPRFNRWLRDAIDKRSVKTNASDTVASASGAAETVKQIMGAVAMAAARPDSAGVLLIGSTRTGSKTQLALPAPSSSIASASPGSTSAAGRAQAGMPAAGLLDFVGDARGYVFSFEEGYTANPDILVPAMSHALQAAKTVEQWLAQPSDEFIGGLRISELLQAEDGRVGQIGRWLAYVASLYFYPNTSASADDGRRSPGTIEAAWNAFRNRSKLVTDDTLIEAIETMKSVKNNPTVYSKTELSFAWYVAFLIASYLEPLQESEKKSAAEVIDKTLVEMGERPDYAVFQLIRVIVVQMQMKAMKFDTSVQTEKPKARQAASAADTSSNPQFEPIAETAVEAPRGVQALRVTNTEASFEGFLARVSEIGSSAADALDQEDTKIAIPVLRLLIGGHLDADPDDKTGDYQTTLRNVKRKTHPDIVTKDETLDATARETLVAMHKALNVIETYVDSPLNLKETRSAVKELRQTVSKHLQWKSEITQRLAQSVEERHRELIEALKQIGEQQNSGMKNVGEKLDALTRQIDELVKTGRSNSEQLSTLSQQVQEMKQQIRSSGETPSQAGARFAQSDAAVVKVLYAAPVTEKTLKAVNAVRTIAQSFGGAAELVEEFSEQADEAFIRAAIEKHRPAIAVFRSNVTFTPELIAFAKQHGVQELLRAGAGYDNVDFEASVREQISLATTGGNAEAVAYLSMRFLLAALGGQEMTASDVDFSSDPAWSEVGHDPADFTKALASSEKAGRGVMPADQSAAVFKNLSADQVKELFAKLEGKTISLLAFGPVAQAFAAKLQKVRELTGVNFTVVAYSPALASGDPSRAKAAAELGVQIAKTKQEAISAANVLSIHYFDKNDPVTAAELAGNAGLEVVLNTARLHSLDLKEALPALLDRGVRVYTDADLAKKGAELPEVAEFKTKHPNYAQNLILVPHIGAFTQTALDGVEDALRDALILSLAKLTDEEPTLAVTPGFTLNIVNKIPLLSPTQIEWKKGYDAARKIIATRSMHATYGRNADIAARDYGKAGDPLSQAYWSGKAAGHRSMASGGRYTASGARLASKAATAKFLAALEPYRIAGTEKARAIQGNYTKAANENLNSYVPRPKGNESGRYIALDFGGTNFRVLIVDMKNGKVIRKKIHPLTIPKQLITSDSSQLFGFIAREIKKVMAKEKLSLDTVQNLGFSFAFRVKQISIDRGTLDHWTKEFKVKGVVGEEVVGLLNQALEDEGVKNIRVRALVNDVIGTLVTRPDAALAAILGTGTNGGYWDELTGFAVNTEWGAFKGAWKVAATEADRIVNRRSEKPGKQLFEKMVSGKYLGEIARTQINLLRKDGFLKGKALPRLTRQGGVTTTMLSKILEDRTKTLAQVGRYFPGTSANERKVIRAVAHALFTRSADLFVEAVYANLKLSGAYAKSDELIVAIDGSVYSKSKFYRRQVRRATRIHMARWGSRPVRYVQTTDGSGLGTARIAAIASAAARLANSNPADWRIDAVEHLNNAIRRIKASAAQLRAQALILENVKDRDANFTAINADILDHHAVILSKLLGILDKTGHQHQKATDPVVRLMIQEDSNRILPALESMASNLKGQMSILADAPINTGEPAWRTGLKDAMIDLILLEAVISNTLINKSETVPVQGEWSVTVLSHGPKQHVLMIRSGDKIVWRHYVWLGDYDDISIFTKRNPAKLVAGALLKNYKTWSVVSPVNEAGFAEAVQGILVAEFGMALRGTSGARLASTGSLAIAQGVLEPYLKNVAAAINLRGQAELALSDGEVAVVIDLIQKGAQVSWKREGETEWRLVIEDQNSGAIKKIWAPVVQETRLSAENALKADLAVFELLLAAAKELNLPIRPVNYRLNVTQMLSAIDAENRADIVEKLKVVLTRAHEQGFGSFFYAAEDAAWGLPQFERAKDASRPGQDAPETTLRNLKALNPEGEIGYGIFYKQNKNEFIPLMSTLLAQNLLTQILGQPADTQEAKDARSKALAALEPIFQKLTRSTIRLSGSEAFFTGVPVNADADAYDPYSVKGLSLRGYIDLLVYLQGLRKATVDTAA